MSKWIVTLDDEALARCQQIAEGRQQSAERCGCYNRNASDDRDDCVGFNLTGICCELAAAIALGTVVNLNAWKGRADLGNGVQVKGTRHKRGGLMIHEGSDPHQKYLLVIDSSPLFELKGWAYGHEVMQPQYQTTFDTEPWLKPQRLLRPVETLNA